jgi:hypothetical protein
MTAMIYFLVIGGVAGIALAIYVVMEAVTWSKPGTIKVEMRLAAGDILNLKRRVKKAVDGDLATFSYNEGSYAVDTRPEYVGRSRVALGLVTVNKLHYKEGIANPINWAKLKVGDTVTDGNLFIAQENHLISDALKALAKEVFSPIMIAIIVCAVVVLAQFMHYRTTSGKLDAIAEFLLVTPVAAVEGEFRGDQ